MEEIRACLCVVGCASLTFSSVNWVGVWVRLSSAAARGKGAHADLLCVWRKDKRPSMPWALAAGCFGVTRRS